MLDTGEGSQDLNPQNYSVRPQVAGRGVLSNVFFWWGGGVRL